MKLHAVWAVTADDLRRHRFSEGRRSHPPNWPAWRTPRCVAAARDHYFGRVAVRLTRRTARRSAGAQIQKCLGRPGCFSTALVVWRDLILWATENLRASSSKGTSLVSTCPLASSSSVVRILHPRWNVALALQHTPDIDVV